MKMITTSLLGAGIALGTLQLTVTPSTVGWALMTVCFAKIGFSMRGNKQAEPRVRFR